MSAGTDIWQLPGPGAYVNEIVQLNFGGQHVAAVLPRYLAGDAERGDALALAVLDKIPQGHRVQPGVSDGPLVKAVAHQVTYDRDPPVTVPDLIRHPDVVGMTFVCLVADLEAEHQVEMADFLRRLETDSRSVPATERCTFVVITDRSRLPQFAGKERSGVTLANCWYWNRVSRWDVAAHLAAHSSTRDQTGVLGEVRTETIIELARWDFDLAARLADSWSGDASDLGALCRHEEDADNCVSVAGRVTTRPPEPVLDAWENGVVDCWHENVVLAPSRRLQERAELNRHLWTGQARVLLPWIEIKRDCLERLLRVALGPERFAQALRDFATVDYGPDDADFVAEIGLLEAVARARIGNDDRKVSNAARALRDARNSLAHLRPIPTGRLEELVRTCEFLR